MASLNSPLLELPLSTTTELEIVNQFWGVKPTPQWLRKGDVNFAAYWEFYSEQCGHALHDGGRHVSARTHQDILDVVQYLKGPFQRHEIRDLLRSKLTAPVPPNVAALLDSSIDLAARLLLMLDFGSLQYGFSGRKQLDWSEGCLRDFVGGYFAAAPKLGHEGVKFEKMFNARNLGRITGIEIVWTRNLADHLRMMEEDRKVAIFHYASFLVCQEQRFVHRVAEDCWGTLGSGMIVLLF